MRDDLSRERLTTWVEVGDPYLFKQNNCLISFERIEI